MNTKSSDAPTKSSGVPTWLYIALIVMPLFSLGLQIFSYLNTSEEIEARTQAFQLWQENRSPVTYTGLDSMASAAVDTAVQRALVRQSFEDRLERANQIHAQTQYLLEREENWANSVIGFLGLVFTLLTGITIYMGISDRKLIENLKAELEKIKQETDSAKNEVLTAKNTVDVESRLVTEAKAAVDKMYTEIETANKAVVAIQTEVTTARADVIETTKQLARGAVDEIVNNAQNDIFTAIQEMEKSVLIELETIQKNAVKQFEKELEQIKALRELMEKDIKPENIKENEKDISSVAATARERLANNQELTANEYYALALDAYQKSNNSEALDHIKQAIERDNTNAEYYFWMGYFKTNLELNEDAISSYRRSIELNPNGLGSLNNLANLLSKHTESHSEAEQLYRKILEINPNYVEAMNNLGNLLSNYSNKLTEAEQLYRKALEINPNYIEAMNNLGNLLSDYPDQHTEAEQLYRKVLEINPNDIEVMSNLGNLLANYPEKHAEAEQLYRKALEIKPDYSNAMNNLGNLLANYPDKHLEAEQLYRKALGIKPDYTNAMYNLGILLANYPDKHLEAEQLYRKVLEIKPNDAEAMNNLGILLSKYSKKHPEAEQLFRKALKIKPDYIYAMNNLAILLSKYSERHAESEHFFHNTLAINPNDKDTVYNLSCLYSIMQQKENMLEYLKRAIELENNFKIIAISNDEFASYFNDPDFRALVGLPLLG